MWSNQLFNEFGAFNTPLANEFDQVASGVLQSIRKTALELVSDPQDWAFYRYQLLAGFRGNEPLDLPEELNQATSDQLYQWGADLHHTTTMFIHRHGDRTSPTEDKLLYEWADGCLSCLAADVQIQLASQKRKQLRVAKARAAADPHDEDQSYPYGVL